MSTNCDRCGYRDNEVKSGSAISEKGKRITLKVEDEEDLSRDILKVQCFPSDDYGGVSTYFDRANLAGSAFLKLIWSFMPAR